MPGRRFDLRQAGASFRKAAAEGTRGNERPEARTKMEKKRFLSLMRRIYHHSFKNSFPVRQTTRSDEPLWGIIACTARGSPEYGVRARVLRNTVFEPGFYRIQRQSKGLTESSVRRTSFLLVMSPTPYREVHYGTSSIRDINGQLLSDVSNSCIKNYSAENSMHSIGACER